MNDNLILTIVLASILMILVVIGLSIGWILTGKSRLKKRCGYIPGQDKENKDSCSLCNTKKRCDSEKHDNEQPSNRNPD